MQKKQQKDTILVIVCCQVGTLFLSEIYLYEWILDTKSQNHRSVRIGRELWGQPPFQGRVSLSTLHRHVSRWLTMCVSRKGDSMTSLSSLFQCSATPNINKFFLMLGWNSLWFTLWPLVLILIVGTTENYLIPYS